MRWGRIKVLSIDDAVIAGLMNFALDGTLKITVPVIPDLPADYQVLGWNRNFRASCIDVVIHSESFDRVPVGFEPPRIDVEYRDRVFVLKEDADAGH